MNGIPHLLPGLPFLATCRVELIPRLPFSPRPEAGKLRSSFLMELACNDSHCSGNSAEYWSSIATEKSASSGLVFVLVGWESVPSELSLLRSL